MAKKRKAAEITIDINANVAALAKDMNRAVSELEKLQRKVASLQKLLTFSLALDTFKTLGPYLKNFATLLGDVAERGEKLGSIRESFTQLGGSASEIEKAKTAVMGVVDSFTLMQIANEGLLKQIPGYADNFGKIADLGNRVADALGIEATEGIKQVTDALATAKDKQLAAVGITIDAEKAYLDYAKAVGVSTKELSDAQKQEARRIAAMEQLDNALAKLPASSDSVANAMGAMKASFDEALGNFAIGINESDELTTAFRDLQNAIGEVDWEEFGRKVASFVTIVVDGLTGILPYVESFFGTILDGIALIDRTILEAKVNGLAGSMDRAGQQLDAEEKVRQQVKAMEKYVRQLDDLQKKVVGAKSKKDVDALIPVLGQYVEIWKTMGDSAPAIKAKLIEITQTVEKQLQVLPEVAKIAPQAGAAVTGTLGEQGEAAAKAKTELDKLNAAWQKYLKSTQAAQNDQADLGAMSDTEYGAFRQKMADAVQQDFYEQWKEKMDLGGEHYQEVMDAANKEVNKAAMELDKKRYDAQQERLNRIRDNTNRAMGNVYAGVAEMGNQLGVDLSGILNVVQDKFSNQMADAMQSIAESIGMTGEGAGAAFADYVGVGLQVVNQGLQAKSQDRATKSNAGTGATVGMAGGAIIGGIFGGPAGAMLGAQIGQVAGTIIGGMIKWGPQNADTKARHVFANWLESQLEQLSAVTLRTRNGQFATVQGNMMNFVEGDSGRFNTPGWADDMNKWGSEARTTFEGLATAIKGVLGITEDVAGQMAYLLGENLAGNIDNARLLVYQLGLSFEDLSEALLKMAKQGEITWQQYVVNLAGVSEAFVPGLKAVNDMKGAVDQFIGSGGRGMAALKGIKDIAIEAIEGGAKTLDDLKRQLVAGGMTPEDADKFVSALRASGVRSLEEIKNLSEAQLGQIVASVGNSVDSINNKWKEIGTNLEKIKYDMDNLPTEKDIKVNFKATFDENMQKASDAGLLDAGNTKLGDVPPPTNQTKAMSVGARQTQAAQTTINSSPNVMKAQSLNVNIDARNAEIGVEERIRTVITSYGDMIAQQAANIVMDNQTRGA